MNELNREKLGTEPVDKLLFTMSVPSVIAMFMQAMYNVVDSMFVAHVSKESFAAVTLAFPIQMIIGALSTGAGVGINSCIARSLGAKDLNTASKAAANGILIGFITVGILILFGIFGSEAYLRIYTDDLKVITEGTVYVRTISILAFGTVFTQIGFSIMQGSGNMVIPMAAQLAGGACVLIFDPILIFGCKLGVLGAAIASSCAQVISMGICTYGVFFRNSKNLPVPVNSFKPDIPVLGNILSVGIPSALTQATTSVVSGVLSKMVAGYGIAAVTVYGGFNKFSSFAILPVFGITRGMQPILGYSVGARDKERFIQTRNLAIAASSVITVISSLVFIFGNTFILNLLKATPDMLDIGKKAYTILGTSLSLTGAAIVLIQIFPPAKKSYLTMIATIMRQAVYMVPLCILFSRFLGITGIWLGYVSADLLNFIFVLCMNIWFNKNVLNKWKGASNEI